jgi:hypothetical protein
MAKKIDPQIQENVDRGTENEQGSAGIDARNKNYDDGTNLSNTIKNANEAGLGAIGRNDEKQTGDISDHSVDY